MTERDAAPGRDAATTAAFDAVRERILAVGRNGAASEGGIAVVLTSGSRGHGVTTVTARLAWSFARAGDWRTLVIDHDAAEGGVADQLGVTPRVLEAPLAGHVPASVLGAIQRVNPYGFDLLTLAPGHARSFTDDPAWETALRELRSQYDVILIDAGSLQTRVPISLGRRADQTILVMDTTSTTVETLERLKADLRYSPRPLTGVILNKRRLPVPERLYRMLR